jgi:hypothetical protein
MNYNWTFGFQPNIWGEPDEPSYHPMFSKSEQIGETTHIVLISAYDLVEVPPEHWYDYMQNIWQESIKDKSAS